VTILRIGIGGLKVIGPQIGKRQMPRMKKRDWVMMKRCGLTGLDLE